MHMENSLFYRFPAIFQVTRECQAAAVELIGLTPHVKTFDKSRKLVPTTLNAQRGCDAKGNLIIYTSIYEKLVLDNFTHVLLKFVRK